MKDLPKVFANKIDHEINNTQEIYYGSDRGIPQNSEPQNIARKINMIFSSPSHVYKSKVRITLPNKIVEKVIVGKTNTDLITMNGELIKIMDIVDIEKI